MNFEWIALGICGLAVLLAGGLFLLFQENRRLRTQNESLNERLIAAVSQLSEAKERARNLEDARSAMSTWFQAASQEALTQSTDALLKRAEESFVARERLAHERMNHTLKPVAETLGKVEAQVRQMEEARLKDTSGLRQEITHLMQASTATREVTQKLANALRRGAGVQGRWGEETLRNVLETAGLTRFDFVEQRNLDTDEGRRRPDVTVRLPGQGSNGEFVIDAKVNLTAFLEAMDAVEDEAREALLVRHAHALRAHVRDLSAKAYWEQFRDKSPDFVALFVPGDGFLAAALERLPDLMNEAMQKKVIIVTPTTLFALCKAVSYGWRVEDSLRNASHIADLGRELYNRLSVMGDHVTGMGKALNNAVGKYNDFVGSLETKVLTQARRFENLQVAQDGKAIAEPQALEATARPLHKLESGKE